VGSTAVASVWEYRHLRLPRGTDRESQRRLATDWAEYGQWELARVRIHRDGRRELWVRRRRLPVVRTGR